MGVPVGAFLTYLVRTESLEQVNGGVLVGTWFFAEGGSGCGHAGGASASELRLHVGHARAHVWCVCAPAAHVHM